MICNRIFLPQHPDIKEDYYQWLEDSNKICHDNVSLSYNTLFATNGLKPSVKPFLFTTKPCVKYRY